MRLDLIYLPSSKRKNDPKFTNALIVLFTKLRVRKLPKLFRKKSWKNQRVNFH